MTRGSILGLWAALVMACGDDGIATTEDDTSSDSQDDDDGDDDDDDDTFTGSSSGSATLDTSTGTATDPTTSTESSSGGDSSSGSSSGSDSSSGSSSSSAGEDESTTTATMMESSTTVSDDEDEAEDDDPSAFIMDPDFASGEECDTFTQDCPDGEKCNAWANDGGNSWNALNCFPLDDSPDQIGDACTVEGSGVSGVDSCDIGLMCWGVDTETNIGYCIGYCQGSPADPSCADPTALCIFTNEVLALCLPGCDPLLQDCQPGEGCYPVLETFVCAPDASVDSGAYGDTCEFINVCDPGNYCGPAESVPGCGGGGCCTPFCDLTDGAFVCPGSLGGQECVPFYAEGLAPPGLEDVGVCAIPT
jgi:hypothetical protein